MHRISRRLFLHESLLAAGAVAAAPAILQAADQPKQSKSPSERLNIAVLGVNGRGSDHIKAYNERSDSVISHSCDVDSAVGNRVLKNFKGDKYPTPPKFVTDMRQVFDDKSVDIVSIATPNHWHALAAIWALQAGKDVYVEKPVSHNISEGRRIV